ncbi:MAG: hypothetical protein L6R37_002261 [Teloschistes peruensis]|nr:MAG: hypothetical protein L6R37_002261 [Teloschistes peruensis]
MNPTDHTTKTSSSQSDLKAEKGTPPRSDPPPAVNEPPEQEDKKDLSGPDADSSQPLAPPPRPSGQQNPSETPDYFSSNHNNSHFSLEPNPFDQSFANPSSDAPNNKSSLLPPVAALTSPAPLVGGQASAGVYNWANSLRSGPLSPAMLGGPVNDYFDPSIKGSFPTPNESSLRTGLTPGGGGSMFPAPSPNSQALYNQLASGGATPSTLDFHRTAMNLTAANRGQNTANGNGQSQEQRAPVASMEQSQHDSEAASGLYLLAQATNNAQANNQFAMPNAPGSSMPNTQPHSHETSPNMTKRATRNANGSIGGSISESGIGQSELDNDHSDSGDQKPTTRNRGKRVSTGKAGANGRRKAEESGSKPAPVKKQKQNNHATIDMDGMDTDDENNNFNQQQDQYHENGKKMTDEEKRKNFLERNRVAALKCRQRKKQWLANLQAKVEIFSSENDTLSAQVNQLRDEIMQLKGLLVAHKDCPIAQAQGIGHYFQQQADYQNQANPYGMAVANGQSMMVGQQRLLGNVQPLQASKGNA